jgi:formamidopyrimidine-DNA glycosylase
MPELPEVETIRTGLEPVLMGKIIAEVLLRRPDLRIPFPPFMVEVLSGTRIEHLGRRSKYLLLALSNQQTLIIHLGMSGKIIYHPTPPAAPYGKHDHVVFKFEGGQELVYNDARRFGLMTLCPTSDLPQHALFIHLGVEPLEDDFTPAQFYAQLQKKKSAIKQVIMDASVVVGVGNIYASESLFRSNIHPSLPANLLTKKQVATLQKNIRVVLQEAIASGGSTLRDYVRSDSGLGYFQHNFRVYGRENSPCITCGTWIERIVQQGRSTFFCPQCQGKR